MGWKDTIIESEETPKKSWKDTIVDDSEENKTSKLTASGRGFVEGLTLGTGGEIGSGMLAALDAIRRGVGFETEEEKVNRQLQEQGFKGDIPTAQDKTILSQYRDLRDTSKAADVKAKEDQIEAYMGGEIVGGLAPVIGSGGASLVGKGVLGATKQGAKIGTVYGALTGLGTSEADLTQGDIGGVAKDVALGAGAGAIGGALAGVTPELMSKGAQTLKRVIGDFEDIGRRVVKQFEKGLESKVTTGNVQREAIEKGLTDEAMALKEAQAKAMEESKTNIGIALKGETKDITPAINKSISELDNQLKTFEGPEADTLKTIRNMLVQEKEKLIKLPEGVEGEFKPLSLVNKDADKVLEVTTRKLKGRTVESQANAVQSILQSAAKLKKGSKIEGMELKSIQDSIPVLANDLGMNVDTVMPLLQDVAKLKFTSPKGAQQEITKIIKQYQTPRKIVDSENGMVYVYQGPKIVYEQPFRPDALEPIVQKNPSDIFDLMKSLRDITVQNPNNSVKKIGKQIDEIFDTELTKGISKEQKELFDAAKGIYRTKYDIDEALGNVAFNAPKGSTGEFKGWSDIRRAMTGLEDVSVVNPNKALAEDIFSKLGKITKQEDLLPRLKEQSTMSNLAEGQSGLSPTKASYLSVGSEKAANILGRGVTYATKGNPLVKMDSAGLKMLAEKTKSSSPELSNFLENLSNVENHTRRNALMFAASQKSNLKDELKKIIPED